MVAGRRFLSISLALMSVAAGCSGGDDDGSTTTTSPSTTAEETSTSSSTVTGGGPATNDTGPPDNGEGGLSSVDLFGTISAPYSYSPVPAAEGTDLRDQLLTDDRASLFLDDVTVRSIDEGEEMVGVVLAFAVVPSAAANPEFRSSVIAGIDDLVPLEADVIGTERVDVGAADGVTYIVWRYENVFAVATGRDGSVLRAAMRALMEPLAGPFPTTTTTTEAPVETTLAAN